MQKARRLWAAAWFARAHGPSQLDSAASEICHHIFQLNTLITGQLLFGLQVGPKPTLNGAS